MSSISMEKSLDLIQKAYHLSPDHPDEQRLTTTHRKVSTIGVVSSLSRKTSIHDVNEARREEMNKRIVEIHRSLCEWKSFLELVHCSSSSDLSSRLNQLREDLLQRMNDFIHQLTKQSEKRGSSMSVRRPSLVDCPISVEHLVGLIEYFHNELLKLKYLFHSTLDRSFIPHLSDADFLRNQSLLLDKDLLQLEEQSHILGQRYSSVLPNWHQLDENVLSLPNETLPIGSLRVGLGRRSSADPRHFATRIDEKCPIFCCICTPKYL